MKSQSYPHYQRWWDLPAAALLLAALITAASRLAATRWTVNLDIVQTLAFFGVILGLALGYSRFSPRTTTFMAIAYGAFFVFSQLGITIDEDLLWMERLSILTNRLGIIIYQLFRREVVHDSLLFLVAMATLFWVLGVYAGYNLVRHGNAWRALLPTGLALIVIHSFDPLVARRAWYLAGFLFFGLVVVARSTYLHRESRWRETHTATPPHLGLEFIRFTVITVLVVVLLAWTVPAMASALPAAKEAWQPISQAWLRTRERFENAFASLRPSFSVVSEYYGSSATLGRGIPLSDAEVFLARAPQDAPPGLRFYWRARTYETYENGQWLSLINSSHPFKPEATNLTFPEEFGRWPGSFNIVAAVQMTTLFSPAQPLWVNRAGIVEYAENPDGTVDLATFRASPPLQPGQTYKAQASITYATIAQLRDAGTEYPDWVKERYLQLPNTITKRTKDLAEQITLNLDNPYDKVVAVTDYLRQNITYSNVLTEDPPQNQEIIDWFLFDYKQGFCNYYATAEIVLLRAVGIPARWAIGYAQGERLTGAVQRAGFEEGTFVVRQRDAHAWPEVFFPDIGWVEFEPTSAQPEIARLPGETDQNANNVGNLDEDEERLRREYAEELALLREERGELGGVPETQSSQSNAIYWIVPLILAGTLLYLGWRFRSRLITQPVPLMLEATFKKIGIRPPRRVQLWARRAELPPLVKAYLEVNFALARLGNPPALGDTPAERAFNLGVVLPPAGLPAERLVNEYHLGMFGNQQANLVIALKAASEIKDMSWRARLQKMLSRLQRPNRSPGMQP